MIEIIKKHSKYFILAGILAFIVICIPVIDYIKYNFFDNVHHASDAHSTVRLQKVMPKTKDIDVRDSQGRTPLQKACTDIFDYNIAKFLIEHGADVDQKSKDGVPLITEIILSKKYDDRKEQMIGLLIANGADINAKDRNGNTPVLTVADVMSNEAMAILVKFKPNVNALNNSGESALYKTIMRNHIRSARILLENNANCNFRTKSGDTLWDVVNTAKQFDFIALLKKYGAKSSQQFQAESAANTSK